MRAGKRITTCILNNLLGNASKLKDILIKIHPSIPLVLRTREAQRENVNYAAPLGIIRRCFELNLNLLNVASSVFETEKC